MKKKVMITGAAGYIGAMLVDIYASRDDIGQVLAIDKDMESTLTLNHKYRHKIVYYKGNLADHGWTILAEQIRPEIIVHAAWQIREIYGKRDVSWLYNIIGSDNVFDFAFSHEYVERLIHFSSVASYGAFADNSFDYRYLESDTLRESSYLYAEEKRIAEEHLSARYQLASHRPMTMVLRPASITGPRLRRDMNKFSLQSALSGKLGRQKGILNKIVSAMTAFMPTTSGWLRQYIHEDDVANIVFMLSLDDSVKDTYEVYNICPAGPVVLGHHMAGSMNKIAIKINPKIIQLVFSFFWHLTGGRVPTSPGVWSGYSYPIGVDGSKISKRYQYRYKWESLAALQDNTEGKYAN